jgi:hypothetical protein
VSTGFRPHLPRAAQRAPRCDVSDVVLSNLLVVRPGERHAAAVRSFLTHLSRWSWIGQTRDVWPSQPLQGERGAQRRQPSHCRNAGPVCLSKGAKVWLERSLAKAGQSHRGVIVGRQEDNDLLRVGVG